MLIMGAQELLGQFLAGSWAGLVSTAVSAPIDFVMVSHSAQSKASKTSRTRQLITCTWSRSYLACACTDQ